MKFNKEKPWIYDGKDVYIINKEGKRKKYHLIDSYVEGDDPEDQFFICGGYKVLHFDSIKDIEVIDNEADN